MQRDVEKEVPFEKRTIIIAALLFIVVFYFTYTGKAHQLKDVIKVDEANVTRIEIDTDEGKRVVDDKKNIKEIVHSLSQVEVKKARSSTKSLTRLTG
ncbi:DUF5301 domain-containing protein [Priestia sp. OVS21]|nr:DUF5301 domain-containing protein [Priestia sp. OVS21]